MGARDHPERARVDGSGLQMDEELDAADVGAIVVVPSGVRGEARGDRRCGNGGSARQRDGPLVEAGIVGDQSLAERRAVRRERQVVASDAARAVRIEVGAYASVGIGERRRHLGAQLRDVGVAQQVARDNVTKGAEVKDLLLAEHAADEGFVPGQLDKLRDEHLVDAGEGGARNRTRVAN